MSRGIDSIEQKTQKADIHPMECPELKLCHSAESGVIQLKNDTYDANSSSYDFECSGQVPLGYNRLLLRLFRS